MKHIIYGFSGVLSFLLFVIGLAILLVFNPQVIEEIDNLAFSYYNIEGMKGQQLANLMLYIGPGVCSLLTLIGLIITNRKSIQSIVGLIVLMISTINWISFGVVSQGLEDLDGDGKFVLLRTIIFIITTIIGLLLVGTDNLKLFDQKVVQWTTLVVGIVIAVLGALSTFVFNDDTWWRTNLSITLFFLWSGFIGFYSLRTKTTANGAYEQGG